MSASTVASSQVWANGEVRKLGLLMASMGVLAHLRRKQMRKRWLSAEVAQDDEQCHPIVDHPVFGYLWENALSFGIPMLLAKYYPKVDRSRPLYSYLLLVVQGWLLVNTTLLMEKFSAAYLYSHVKYFTAKRPSQDLMTVFKDYLRCNLPVDLVNGIMQLGLLYGMSDRQVNKLIDDPPKLRVIPYLIKFAFCRLTVDIAFGMVHRVMHENQWVYDNVHRVHHEHTAPRTQTNLHFTWLDQFLEAVFPIYVAFGILNMIGHAPNRYEQAALTGPLLYFESSSHTGKEIPIVTWFPLLSPLVDWITGCDQRLIEYHTRHHQLYRCNYSISPWWDKLLGTYRIDLPKEYNAEGSYE